ncbi:hypothetical protein CAPTEDRAFT_211695 [Capitella teleta]|uniref:Uncharacterized protein n=1 Tax=Capitella teleta TaxID=283909 RepID=R7UNI6_CAPTE|nr:hypothetical protein CAPTEDRAFT_211695 [Capitella teleta]|eukprot:ELU07653.1 hypothetical protein CAPTEDRAFT_211695 [Capitella teleta]
MEGITQEQLPLLVIHAVKDPSVLESIQVVLATDHDLVVDLAAAKNGPEMKSLEEAVAASVDKIAELENKVELLIIKGDKQEQYPQCFSIRNLGIGESLNKDPYLKIKRLFQAMGVDPVIQRCHRFGPLRKSPGSLPLSSQGGFRCPAPRPILCQFTGQRGQDGSHKARKEVNGQYPSVYLNKDLSKLRASITTVEVTMSSSDPDHENDEKIKNLSYLDPDIHLLVQKIANAIA